MLGKELRNTLSNTWLNYAIPVDQMTSTIDEIRSGKFVRKPTEDPKSKPQKPLTLDLLGLVLVPDVLERTPPYIDAVRPASPAAAADSVPTTWCCSSMIGWSQSCKALASELTFVDRIDTVKVTVIREQDLVDVKLAAPVEP